MKGPHMIARFYMKSGDRLSVELSSIEANVNLAGELSRLTWEAHPEAVERPLYIRLSDVSAVTLEDVVPEEEEE
jgi:hypothetical protein